MGIFVIISCVIITWIYTYVANTFLDREFGEAIKRLEKADLIDENGKLKGDEIWKKS